MSAYAPSQSSYSPARHGAPAVSWLIGLSVAVAFLQATLTGDALMREWLGYHATDLHDRRVWTVVTYMFVHGGLLHLAFNMYMLWVFGRRVERAWGSTMFTWFYLWCGVSGWAFHWIFTPRAGVLIGASAAILGVAVAYASRWPDHELYLFGIVPMKVRWFVVFLAVTSVALAVLNAGAVGGTAYAAHLGGMFGGWLYLKTPTAQGLETLRQRIAPAPDYGDEPPRVVPPRGAGRPRPSPDIDDVVAKSKAATAKTQSPAKSRTPVAPPRTAVPPDDAPAGPGSADRLMRAALDALLDKIADQGMHALTERERTQLQELSRRLRGTQDSA